MSFISPSLTGCFDNQHFDYLSNAMIQKRTHKHLLALRFRICFDCDSIKSKSLQSCHTDEFVWMQITICCLQTTKKNTLNYHKNNYKKHKNTYIKHFYQYIWTINDVIDCFSPHLFESNGNAALIVCNWLQSATMWSLQKCFVYTCYAYNLCLWIEFICVIGPNSQRFPTE